VTGLVCGVANDNAEGQVVISGAKVAIDKAMVLSKDYGARRAIPLPVSAPFHCALMQPAADRMAEALAEVAIEAPAVPLVANVLATAITDPDEIRKRLIEQVTGTVRWRESGAWMAEQGVRTLYEIGAGKVLTGLVRRIDERLEGRAVGTVGDIESAGGQFAAAV
jgi:[acyl-carrier-protein] S-malonyltransferase